MVVATILLVFEFIGADFDGLLPGAVLALGLSVLTSLWKLPAWLHGLLFTALAVGGVLALRSWSGFRWGPRPEPRADAADARASGSQLARVSHRFDADGSGHVRWRGKLWSAYSIDGESPLERGESAEVVGREGDALLVRRPGEPEG